MTWLESTDQWPVHPRAETQKALKRARGAGWQLKPSSGKPFGVIRCDESNHDSFCRVVVFRTPRGPADGSVTAGIIDRKVQQCTKRRPEETPPSIDFLEQRLHKIEGNIATAAKLRAAEDLERRSEAAIDRLPDGATTREEDRALDASQQMHEQARTQSNDALQHAIRFGIEQPWPRTEGSDTLYQEAANYLHEIEPDVRSTNDPQLVSKLEELLSEIHQDSSSATQICGPDEAVAESGGENALDTGPG